MSNLPHQCEQIFLLDGGLETDMIFNRGFNLPAFAAHTLLFDVVGREALTSYFHGFLDLAREKQFGFLLDAPTWRAQTFFAEELGATLDEIRRANFEAVEFVQGLKQTYADQIQPLLINGLVGPCGDAYGGEHFSNAASAQAYHRQQISWLAEAGVDIVGAFTLTSVNEAIGIVRASQEFSLPVSISFTLETNGHLPMGIPLSEAIARVDEATNQGAAYFMVNCAHPDHFSGVITEDVWTHRLGGFRCNPSRRSHAELDEADFLDIGNPVELAHSYWMLKQKVPTANVFGACCGSDLRHVREIARVLNDNLTIS
ncbi:MULTISPECIES: homocysteine S-methyltransferase family protein [unclassified Synechocystis]|uniref:homocysteine S-methyltransferase family protein n=1 Tax=unclassified Synechocystis TaxID=2640012 RepID=UPI0004157DEC|nr:MULTISPECIES: homocysteine S-methyltransferase family protein [unclassified Synechocystis]MCT0254258.1 homocysteine S-methyltransferase family protein [Synechocystis sp. CS-94]